MAIPVRTYLMVFLVSFVTFAPAQSIKRFPLDDQSVYHLKVSTDKVTTLLFPQPITALEGSGLTSDPQIPANMLLSYHEGDHYLSIRALVAPATASLNIIINRKIYVFELVTDPEPFQSVTFYSPTDTLSGHGGERPMREPSRLLGMLDQVKAYPLLLKQYPEMVSQIENAQPFTSTHYEGFSVVLTEVFRFDIDDALVFQLEFVNETDRPIGYIPQSLAVRVGPKVYWSALSDASGIMNAGQRDPQTGKINPGHSIGYFLICGTDHGGRNYLSVQNKFNILVFRRRIRR